MRHKVSTLAEYDEYMVWTDAWLKLSGFGAFVEVDHEVRASRASACASRERDEGRVAACGCERERGDARCAAAQRWADAVRLLPPQKKPGERGFVRPAQDENGKMKVMLPEMLVGLMLVRSRPQPSKQHARARGRK